MVLRVGMYLVLAVLSGTAARAQDATLILAAQRAPVASLDSTARGGNLRDWMTALAGVARQPASAVKWEVNDCGEGGDGRKAPTCVEARLGMGRDTVAVSVIVAGLDGTLGTPQIFMLYTQRDKKVDFVKTLGALERFVRGRQP